VNIKNQNFTKITVNPVITIVLPEIVKESLQKYISYNDEWEKSYFDKSTGGYIVINKQRIEHSLISKNEKNKFNKEYIMCLALSRAGYKIEILKERTGFSSSDITINGIKAELKKTSSHNNIFNYARKAIDKQGAKIVIFEFEKETVRIKEELKVLKEKGISAKYFFSKKPDKITDL